MNSLDIPFETEWRAGLEPVDAIELIRPREFVRFNLPLPASDVRQTLRLGQLPLTVFQRLDRLSSFGDVAGADDQAGGVAVLAEHLGTAFQRPPGSVGMPETVLHRAHSTLDGPVGQVHFTDGRPIVFMNEFKWIAANQFVGLVSENFPNGRALELDATVGPEQGDHILRVIYHFAISGEFGDATCESAGAGK